VGKTRSVRIVHGPEIADRLLDQGVYRGKVEPDFSRPEMPADIAFIEAFNIRLRQERLNAS